MARGSGSMAEKDEDDRATRLCVVTRKRLDPARLVRFVASDDGAMVPDVAAKLPGRGAWVTAEPALVETAINQGKLAKALDAAGARPPAVDQLDRLLLKRCQEMLSIGRRAGLVAGGGGKIRALEGVEALVVASDASQREARALKGDVAHGCAVEAMSGEELGAVFGRPSIAYAAVLRGNGKLGGRIREELQRLVQWRGAGPDTPGKAGE